MNKKQEKTISLIEIKKSELPKLFKEFDLVIEQSKKIQPYQSERKKTSKGINYD
ncbi:MAG: hypothetical protein FWD87_05140 [Spirochaetaceae bacterium]|nr:hypothetical protein [Spirochaetaceae bacterium]